MTATTASNRTDGRRFLVHAAFVVALLGVVVSAAANWFVAGMVFFNDQVTDDDHRSMALGFAVAAGLLVLALLPAAALRLHPVVWILAVLLAAGCAVVAQSLAGEIAAAPPAEYPEPWSALQVMAWLPTSWPLFGLLLVTPVLVTKRYRTGHSAPRG